MTQSKNDTYNAVIIGAGMSGLVCGCYLAKAGMKVLIAEQHHKPGGYCTSFKRGGFTFDAAAHSFGGYRKGGIVHKVFHELGIDEKVNITRYDPSDIINTPDYKVSFWSDVDQTIKEFQKAFPDESNNIRGFFNFLIENDAQSFVRLRNRSFENLLDQYFNNHKLKSILSFPLLGNGGLPPSRMSAFIGARLFIEFLLDGGYYPRGGMQELPCILADRFKELGGTLLLSSQATEIVVRDKSARGVVLEKEGIISSDYVISNCDARQTFLSLAGSEKLDQELLQKLSYMTSSLSIFVLYLGIAKNCKLLPAAGSNIWHMPHYDIETMYLSASHRNAGNVAEYMVRVSPDRQTVTAYINAAFYDKIYWHSHKKHLQDVLLSHIERYTIPGLTEYILYKDAATPSTMYKYTLNEKGAAYGWASTPDQFADPDFRRPSCINGLFLTGHWATQGMGIPGVAYLGYDTANLILKKKKMPVVN